MKYSKLLLVFLPAILLVAFALFVQITRYDPLIPDIKAPDETATKEFVIPILPTDPIIGEKSAPITIIAFEDFACQACQAQNNIINTIEEQHPGRVKIIWKGLPVTQFPYASDTAMSYAYCANKQKKFKPFKELAFTNGQNLSPAILDSIADEIELDREKLTACLQGTDVTPYVDHVKTLAQILQIQSVPTFFIDNKQIQHPTTLEGWEVLLKL